MKPRSTRVRALMVILGLTILGIASAAYVLLNQGSGSDRFADSYEIKVSFTAADGVSSGVGQPVNVAGVKVGSITGTAFGPDGNAVVTMRIRRDELPRVYADATASLEPITPLKDLRIDLNPGRPPARRLSEGATIDVARTQTPVPLQSLLASLDADSRSYVSALLASLDQGTKGRGGDLRRALVALGPTTEQAGRITAKLKRRRRDLARLVSNLAVVTRAASRDDQLAEVVQAGNATLQAIATQDAPLRESIKRLPPTLRSTTSTLGYAAQFSDELKPALDALLPAVRRLPSTLRDIRPFTDQTTVSLKRDLRPLVREAQPLARSLGRATPRLSALSPDMASVLQALRYTVNELAYNPPGTNEGFLFWGSWFFHNWQSLVSTEDAHGMLGRATFMTSCTPLASQIDAEIQALYKAALGLTNACPGGTP